MQRRLQWICESAFGRCDVILEPLDRRGEGMILEFKVFNPRTEKNLQETVRKAVCQIMEKKYISIGNKRDIKRKNSYLWFCFLRKRSID